MEIDFLGLNSPNCNLEQDKSKNPYIDAGGGDEISLSLNSSSTLDFSEKKKWEEKAEQLPSTPLLVAQPLFCSSGGGDGARFVYDLNDGASTVNLRNMSQLSIEPPSSLAQLYPMCPNVFTEPEKADQNKVYVSGNASTGGYTPTVAMARRATLTRFLEKRSHRMNQARTSQIMGRSTNSEPCETKNNKRNNNLKRKS